ncbi:hypothetical protein [Actinomycetospora sp. TBRC 11914]|uniref:hypothetical protein n=1 Tax=Actinomycetospora sp. TBRC 11914 TaxID=2729387 RepID=UPI00145D6D8C|nr:hypothetical protein [Actinomycetospora sp. TBRC 11914]NMO90424.1 hypothetical protein [Actinomycetospora sp. TBRC 11914]
MGHHSTHQDNDRLGGLVGRGAMTGLAALALLGGGAGVALADEAPADVGHDATQSQSQHQDSSKDSGDQSSKGDSSQGDSSSKSSDDSSSKGSSQGDSSSSGSDQSGSDQSGSDEGNPLAGTPLSALPISGLPISSGAAALQQAPAALQGAASSAPIVSSLL